MISHRALPQLTDIDDPTRSLGGKAATLSILAVHGFRIPPGFVVTAAALEELGDELDGALGTAADRTGAGPFAVRSSATAEDLPDASYAGQYETYLNVDRSGLADAVRRGFAAALDPRVAAYHAARTPSSTTDSAPLGMAMLVQQMIEPVAAGVAFTANPLTGKRDETIVTAVRGLGEPLVSGDAVGEEWILSDGEARLSRGSDGVISQEQARRVAQLAREVEERLGTPQDIEWAIDPLLNLYLLQARPMTALPDPVEWAPPGPGLWARNFRLGEWLPEAMTPLFADWLLPRLEAGYLDGMKADTRVVVPFRYASVNGWYYNATPIPSLRVLWRVLRDSRGRAPRFLYNALVRVSINPAAADRAVLHRLEIKWREQLLPHYRRLVKNFEVEVDSAPTVRLVDIVDEVAQVTGEYTWSLAIVGGSAWKMESALARFWRKHLAGPLDGTPAGAGGHEVLLRGLPGAEPNHPGHAVYSLDWFYPTAGEAPAGVRNASPIAGERIAALGANRADAEAASRAALRDRPNLLARFNALLSVTQHYAVLREEQSRDMTLGWPLLRRCTRQLGQHLQAAGAINDVDDVYFLTLGEATDSSTPHTRTAQERRALWARQRRLAAPLTLGDPPRLTGDPVARAVASARTRGALPDGAIIGHPASTGLATGRVRIMAGPEDFDSFLEGEILVAKATAPAWTPLFALAAAVVTDGGTLAAHASLVAREYGIPAVVGTGNATTRLYTGQVVSVDGGAGIVLPA